MMREQTQLAEDASFTTVWLTEHHFAHNGYLNAPPNPIMMSLDLASHSKKIRVGQALLFFLTGILLELLRM